MAKRKKKAEYDVSMKKMFTGALTVIFGAIKYLGYSWEMAIIVVGVLIFLKGLLMKSK